MKGITPIIATIVLLLITMGLLAMAYTFMSGLFNVEKSFVYPTDAITCAAATGGGNVINLYVFNNGQQPLAIGGTPWASSFDILEVDGTAVATGTATIAASKTGKLLIDYRCGATAPAGCSSTNHRVRAGIGTNIQEITVVCP